MCNKYLRGNISKDINKIRKYNLNLVVPNVIPTTPIDGVVSRGGVCN